jgi:hypothetical protein
LRRLSVQQRTGPAPVAPGTEELHPLYLVIFFHVIPSPGQGRGVVDEIALVNDIAHPVEKPIAGHADQRSARRRPIPSAASACTGWTIGLRHDLVYCPGVTNALASWRLRSCRRPPQGRPPAMHDQSVPDPDNLHVGGHVRSAGAPGFAAMVVLTKTSTAYVPDGGFPCGGAAPVVASRASGGLALYVPARPSGCGF